MKLYQVLEQQLKKEPNFTTDNGELKKWVVINKAQNFDEELLEILLNNDELKSKFFKTVANATVFNQGLFIQFLEQKNYLNDSYTQYKNKVGLTIDNKFLKQRNEVSLVWPFKDCILEGGQSREEDKREEIFFNEILAQDEITQLLDPKVLTNAKHFDTNGEKPLDKFNRNADGTITDNLIIKGNNLLALHTLKEEFAGKVKLIYIDPPYNTGNDGFKYNDSFNHSTWLTFMKNRLQVARDLLRKDGVIFVQCDDNEQAYLKVLMDEVFIRESFVTTIHVQMSTTQGMKVKAAQDGNIVKNAEYILVYSKDGHKNIAKNPLFDIRPEYDEHYSLFLKEDGTIIPLKEVYDYRFPKDLANKKALSLSQSFKKSDDFNEFVKENLINIVCDDKVTGFDNFPDIKLKNKHWIEVERRDKKYLLTLNSSNNIRQLLRLSSSWGETDGYKNTSGLRKIRGDWWEGFYLDMGNVAKEDNVEFKNGKKPQRLVEQIIKMVTDENDIVLDYHLGSGTTASVAHKINRQYIGIEQMDYIETSVVNRLKKAIDEKGGSFVYLELKKYNQTFIEQIEEAKDSETLLKIWELMKEKSFLNYNVDIKKQDEHIEEFKALELAQQKQHLCELLNKNQLYVNRSAINDERFECTETEKKITTDFYQTKH